MGCPSEGNCWQWRRFCHQDRQQQEGQVHRPQREPSHQQRYRWILIRQPIPPTEGERKKKCIEGSPNNTVVYITKSKYDCCN